MQNSQTEIKNQKDHLVFAPLFAQLMRCLWTPRGRKKQILPTRTIYFLLFQKTSEPYVFSETLHFHLLQVVYWNSYLWSVIRNCFNVEMIFSSVFMLTLKMNAFFLLFPRFSSKYVKVFSSVLLLTRMNPLSTVSWRRMRECIKSISSSIAPLFLIDFQKIKSNQLAWRESNAFYLLLQFSVFFVELSNCIKL